MKDNYSVFKDEDGKWKGKRDDSNRASVVGDTQRDVIDKTRDLAIKSKGELSIHRGDNGRIRDKWSYGNDPRNIKG